MHVPSRTIHGDQQTVGAPTIEARVRGLLPALTPAERGLAEHVLADPVAVANSTITALAERCSTSRTTVTRFCRSLGLTGYAELRLALASETGRTKSWNWTEGLGSDVDVNDPIHIVLAKLAKSDAQVIEDTAAQIDQQLLAAAVKALAAARRIDIYAVSGSGAIARDLYLRLHRIGRHASAWTDVHDALTSAALLDEHDVALGLSHSGETREVVEPLRIAGRNGATTIAITNFPRSQLAALADITLLTTAHDLKFRSGGMSGRHAQMLVLDCLYIGVVQRRQARATHALAVTADVLAEYRPPTRNHS
jgi:DNA-binding MurR/RpiR family transcriptional regulator